MESEIFTKKVTLTSSKNAIIKSKWSDQVEFTIFIREDFLIYTGACSLESLKKKKEDIDVDIEIIKATLSSADVKENIRYELDEMRLKFAVVAQDNSDSEAYSEIYIKTDVTKVTENDVILLAMNLVEEMIEMSKIKMKSDQNKEDFKELQKRFQAVVDEKVKREETLLSKFQQLLNSKKKQIAKLTRQLAIKTTKGNSNRHFNLSSDFDQSDFSDGKLGKTLKSLQSSQDSPQPSTSAAALNSPARKKITPKARTPKSKTKTSTPRGTPKKATQIQPTNLFKFEKTIISDDSEDLIEIEKKVKSQPDPQEEKKIEEKIFEGLKMKVSRSLRDSEEKSRSSAELFISRKRLSSSESTKSRQKSETPDFIQPAQVVEELSEEKFKRVTRTSSQKSSKSNNSKARFKSSQDSEDDIFTECQSVLPKPEIYTQAVDDEIVESSQTNDSPSIFETFSKRKAKKSPNKTSKRVKKSVFSVDTEDLFADQSP